MEYQKLQEKVSETLDTIFEGLEVSGEREYKEPEDKDHTRVEVHISSPDANILIGYHGETLHSLQHIVNTMLYREFGEGFGVLIDVEGYRKDRETKLIEIAENASSKARFLNKSIALYPMNSYERKVVHEQVSKIDGVTSASDGEGAGRRVIISSE